MKCTYRFAVTGRLRPEASLSVPTGRETYEFVVDDGLLTGIEVTVDLDRDQWPLVNESSVPGVRGEVNPRLVHLPFIQQDIRSLQGLLASFGVHSIDWRQPEVRWVPDDEQEMSELALHHWKVEEGPAAASEVLPFDILARAVLAAHDSYGSQVPLSFFRRGINDIIERAYVDAIYDFYFVLETLYADGKFRSKQVKEVFKANSELMASIRRALAEPPPPALIEPSLNREYSSRFGSMTPENLVDHLVDVRGQLHHHSLKDSRQRWHPEEQDRHRADALMFQNVAMAATWNYVERHLYDPSVLQSYEAIRLAANQGSNASNQSVE